MIPDTMATTTASLCRILAPLLGYPTPALPAQAGTAAEALRAARSRAAGPLEAFAAFVADAAPGALEELYTRTFDLKPVAYPYVGFQLFGETYRRGEFLVLLQARYRAAGFAVEGELPDHLAVITRFLAEHPDPDLVAEGVIPALEKMLPPLMDNPYRLVLQGLLLVMQGK